VLPASSVGKGVIKPGTVFDQMFASLDWVPTLVDIAGGPKGDGLKKQIEAGQYPGIVKTTLDGFDQRDFLEGKSEQSARDHFFYYSGSTPSAVRYKNWKMYYTMSKSGATAWLEPLVSYHFTLVQNIKRDPFEQFVTFEGKSATNFGGALGAPSTAFVYDFGILPTGQQLWLGHLQTFKTFPPLQAPETFNLSGISTSAAYWNRSRRGKAVTRANSSLRSGSSRVVQPFGIGQRGEPLRAAQPVSAAAPRIEDHERRINVRTRSKDRKMHVKSDSTHCNCHRRACADSSDVLRARAPKDQRDRQTAA
jgi:hypothetical protein